MWGGAWHLGTRQGPLLITPSSPGSPLPLTRIARFPGSSRTQANLSNPLVSPILADLSGLPPLLIQVGGAETLRDEGVVFADRARAAGVTVELEVYPDMVHVFQALPSILVAGNATRAQAAIGAFVVKHIPGPAAPVRGVAAAPLARL